MRHGDLQPGKQRQTVPEALSLARRQPERRPQDERAEDRRVAVAPALAASRPQPATTAPSIQSVIAPRATSAMVQKGQACGHLAVAQGLLWRAIGLDEEDVVCMAGYQMAASLSTAALRLGLIGAIEAQEMMPSFLNLVADLAREPVSRGQPLHSFTLLAEIATALHGSSGQRLFYN